MVSAKGKEKITDAGWKGKRKWSGRTGGDDDKTGRKRKNPGAVQFIDQSAYEDDEEEYFRESSSDDSGFESESFEDGSGSKFKVNNDHGKTSNHPDVIKEEVMSEEEFDRMMEERYKPGTSIVTYAEDGYDQKNSIDSIYVPSAKDPTIWKVKCMVGRERYSALCLMQKYADLTYLQNKLQIISACALDHVKGFIIVEAEKQHEIYEACKGLSTIYSSKVTAVPSTEISRLLSVRSKSSAITTDMWARVKNGKYKGDLAKVVAVNDERKKVTVQLIPRIDLKSLAEKFGGGIPTKRTAIPAQRLITPSELEEFRPLIHSRRDRDANMMFEILDGMMLKDGYLYKKIAIDSLSFWGIVPTEDELLKFEPAKKDESTDVQWLSQLFGEKKKKEVKRIKPDKGGGKSAGSSSANPENNFELHDLVFFGRKDFGVVIDTQKDDTVKVIKEGSEGPLVVAVKQSELKIASFDRKLFTVLDQHSNTLTVNDEVRVLDGPLKGRQGIIKKIYKGILFLHDESEEENNGYICIKAQVCEKVNLSGDDPNEKEGEPVPSGFADLTSSPKSPLSPDKTLQEKDNKSNFARDDNGMFSVGQSLRIRVGPLKGYICRVLAVRRSDVTVKLDSKHKIITVKSEHLSEVRERNSAIAQGEDSGSVKPFDFLGGQDGSRDWMDGAALSTEDNKWNAGGSIERSSWTSVPSSGVSLPKESGSGDPADDPKKEESSWQLKETPNQSSSWGAAAANTGWGKVVEPQLVNSGEALQDDSWGKAAEKWNSIGDASASKAVWGQTAASSGKQIGGDLDQPETSVWGSAGGTLNVDAVGWAVSAADKQDSQTKGWATGNGGDDVTDNNQNDSWNKPSSVCADSGTSWPKQDSKSSWGKSEGTPLCSKQDGGSSWGKKEDACQEVTLGGPKTFDSGRGSGGRSSGGGGQGGRDNYGRGRSFDQDQSSSWSKEGQFGGSKDAGKSTSWSNNPAGGWGNSVSDEGSKGNDGWGKENVSGKDEESAWNRGTNAYKDVGGQGWGSTNPEGDRPSGWNASKDSNIGNSSVWGRSSNANEQAGAAGSGGSSWDKLQKPNENNKSSWNAAATSLDGNQSSGWSKENNWGGQKASEENSGWNQSSAGNGKDGSSGSWNVAKNNDDSSTGWKNNGSSSAGWKSHEGSSNGWSQSNWSKEIGTSESGGNQDGTWSSKGNWNSGGGFNDRNNQGDGGRGGGWRGRGGRGDRGGFRGRGGSDSGDFGGRGGRGRFGGRVSDRGGYGGRGGFDREGFRGRDGSRGRGRGDWNNREDRSSSWGRGSNNDGEGWKSTGNASSWKQGDGGNSWGSSSQGGTWNQKGSENNQSQGWNSSWNQSKGEALSSANAQAGGWGKTNDYSKDVVQSDAGGGAWELVGAPAREVSVGWGKPSANKEMSSWNNNPASNDITRSSWNQSKGNASSSVNARAGEWVKANDSNKDAVQSDAGGGGWESVGASAKEVSVGWGKPSANKEMSSWNNNPALNDATPSVKVLGPADTREKAAGSSWGAPPVSSNSSGGWNKPEITDGVQTSSSAKVEGPSDSWSKAATGAWGGAPPTNSNSTKDEGPSDSWGKAATSTWGSGSGSGKGGW